MAITVQRTLETAWLPPSRREAFLFWVRSRLLIIARSARDLRTPRIRRWSVDDALSAAPIVARSITTLWSDDDAHEFPLTAGKVHNLRIAARAFDGIGVPGDTCLSFWRQLGRPSTRNGFVPGREIREGCLIPTIAGGICQLSNALATCATHAGFELVERHAHSVAIAQRDGETQRVDATVFWNYVDLRVRAPGAWRLEVELSATDLIVTIRAGNTLASSGSRAAERMDLRHTPKTSSMRSCFGCDEVACFRHQKHTRVRQARHAWLLDTWTPEFASYLRECDVDADSMIPLPTSTFRRRSSAGEWMELSKPGRRLDRAGWASLRRLVWQRFWAKRAGRRQASILDGRRWLAESYARRLSPEHTHLIVDQGLLPYLHCLGALGGRSYEVLAAELPMTEIERRLDVARAHAAHNAAARATLADFRVDARFAAAELDAMSKAQTITTAHADVARYWLQRGGIEVRRLPWTLPQFVAARTTVAMTASPERLLVFPASALARKGAYVLALALRGLACRVRVLGSRSDDLSLWAGLDVEHSGYAKDWLSRANAVVLPAYVEHSPRAALAAIAAGIPVVASSACGLDGLRGVTVVPDGNVAALHAALSEVLMACRSG